MTRRPEYPNKVDVPDPVEGERLSGAHWWDPDRLNHLSDVPKFCPNCGESVTGTKGISVEFWEADLKVFHTWCNSCGWAGHVARVDRMVGHEAED